MSVADCFAALLKKSSPAYNRIIWNIRFPRIIAAIVAGADTKIFEIEGNKIILGSNAFKGE